MAITPFKVNEFGINRKLITYAICELAPIWPRFRDILVAFDRSKIATLTAALVFNYPDGGVPWEISVQFYLDVNRWPAYQMAYRNCRKFQSSE